MREMFAWCLIIILLMAVLFLLDLVTLLGAILAFVAAMVWALVMWSVDPERPLSDYRGDKAP